MGGASAASASSVSQEQEGLGPHHGNTNTGYGGRGGGGSGGSVRGGRGGGGNGGYGGYDEEESSSLASQGNLVYGDHRRRKAVEKGAERTEKGAENTERGIERGIEKGPREEHYYPRHVLCDGRNDRPSAYSQPPAHSSLSFTQTLPIEWPSRPSSSLTDTSSLSGASSRGHTENDSQQASPRGNNSLCVCV